jgi:hypothetical protein
LIEVRQPRIYAQRNAAAANPNASVRMLKSLLLRYVTGTSGRHRSSPVGKFEEAMYAELARRSPPGEPVTKHLIVPIARDLVTHTLITIDLFQIQLIDLTRRIIDAHCNNLELQERGIVRTRTSRTLTGDIEDGFEDYLK